MRTRLIFVLPGCRCLGHEHDRVNLHYDEALDAGKVLLMVELAC